MWYLSERSKKKLKNRMKIFDFFSASKSKSFTKLRLDQVLSISNIWTKEKF